MSTKKKIFVAYLVIGLLFGFFGYFFGDNSHKSLAYNMGQGIFWPTIIFPALKGAISALIIVVFLVILMAT